MLSISYLWLLLCTYYIGNSIELVHCGNFHFIKQWASHVRSGYVENLQVNIWGGFLKEIAVASQRLSQPRLRLSQLRQNRSCPFLKTAKRFSKNDNSHRSVRYRSQPSYKNQTLHI